METMDKLFYEAPQILVFEVNVERTILNVSGRDSYDTDDTNYFTS